MLAGTTDSGTVSAGSWHFDLRVGTTQERPVAWPFFARQQGATPSSAAGGDVMAAAAAGGAVGRAAPAGRVRGGGRPAGHRQAERADELAEEGQADGEQPDGTADHGAEPVRTAGGRS